MTYHDIEFNVAGVTFDGRQKLLKKIRDIMEEPEHTLFAKLVRERDNVHDSNAIKILVFNKRADGSYIWYPIGYVPHEISQSLAHEMDTGHKVYTDRIEIVGGNYNVAQASMNNLGCKVFAKVAD